MIVEDDAADAELMVAESRHSGFELSWERVQTEEEYLSRAGGFSAGRYDFKLVFSAGPGDFVKLESPLTIDSRDN